MALDTNNPFPKRLREARLAKNYTQERLGVAAGMDQNVASSRMNQYEKGVHSPDFKWIAKIADVLGYPTAYFFTTENDLAEMISNYKSAKKPSEDTK